MTVESRKCGEQLEIEVIVTLSSSIGSDFMCKTKLDESKYGYLVHGTCIGVY